MNSEERDWSRTAIVVQGGGMRTAFAAGALDGLPKGWRSAVGFASSAGAINLAYFFCDQMTELRRLYFELVLKRGVVRPARFWRIVDVDRLMRVMKTEVPLRIPKGGLRITVPVLRSSDASVEYVDLQGRSSDEVYTALAASSAIPILYGRRVTFQGVDYVDGALSDTLPVEYALSQGMTELLVISNRPLSARRYQQPFLKRHTKQLLALGSGHAVSRLVAIEDPTYNEMMARLESGAYGSAVHIAAPNDQGGVETRRTETGRNILNTLWLEGSDCVRSLNLRG